MSTLSSPRPSINSSRAHSPASLSRRPSLDTLNTNVGGAGGATLSASSTPTRRAVSPLNPRRNRTALRDYYNLKPSDATSRRSRSVPRATDAGDLSSPTASSTAAPGGFAVGTELDNPDFDAQRYVEHLLSTSSLATVLKAENTLVGDIRTLDGERKALVYDNYSKLIRAVETIGRMRRSMDDRGAPLTMTKTLGPSIAFVAETAAELIRDGEEQKNFMREGKGKGDSEAVKDTRRKRDTVRWVLATPERLGGLLEDGKRGEAVEDWKEVKELLDRWEGVKGVAELREACEKVMGTISEKEEPS